VIVQYNVDFLFLKAGESQLACPGAGCDWKNMSIAESHVEHVAKEIASLNGDIILMNEVEDCDVVRRVANLTNMGYQPYLIPGKDTFTGQNTALLTRIDPIQDIQRTETTASFPVAGSPCPTSGLTAEEMTGTQSNSKHLMARFKIEGLDAPLTIVATHLLAGPDDQKRCFQREAQAEVLINAFLKPAAARGDHVIMMGDMNDYDIDVKDSNANVPISSTVKLFRESVGLQNAANLVPQEDRYSDWDDRDKNCVDRGGNEHSLIDHMLLPPALYAKASARIDHSYAQTCGCLYSDHWPTIVTIDL